MLFNHDRDEVIGKITKAWIDNGRGMATIEFDSDEASEVIYQKVKGGTLKGVSVGYLVDDWEEVMPNKTSTDGRFMGPCSIAKKWAPYEISIVSVPADPTVGVGREMEEKSAPGTQDLSLIHISTKNDVHPTMKPVNLVGRLMRNSSKPGSVSYTHLDVYKRQGLHRERPQPIRTRRKISHDGIRVYPPDHGGTIRNQMAHGNERGKYLSLIHI